MPHLQYLLQWLAGENSITLIAVLGILMFTNSAIMIPPSEYLCIFAGIVAETRSGLFIAITAIVLIVANVLGTSVWYLYGRYRANSNKELIPILIWKWLPRILRELYLRDVPALVESFESGLVESVFWFRLVAFVRSIVSYPAGYARMPPRQFLCLTTAGISAWVILWMGLGYWIGAMASQFSLVIGAIVAAIAIALFYVMPPFGVSAR
jgi:membrane protein DedA with SNARE-associated domain